MKKRKKSSSRLDGALQKTALDKTALESTSLDKTALDKDALLKPRRRRRTKAPKRHQT